MDRSRYMVIETQNFTGSGEGPAKTSFLRLGGIADAKLVEDEERMRASTPSAGAVTAATGAGEDLAARVTEFHDDDRDRCDPPHLDDDDDTAAAEISATAEVFEAKRKLDEAKERVAAIDVVLLEVLEDAPKWLNALFDRSDAARSRRDDLRRRYEEAVALHAAAAASPRPGERPHFAPGYTTKHERREETARLHTKGGWRDHTDGNRIVTTRGDKVEVVRGNYRQVVLGRQNAPHDAMGDLVLPGQEISGGHVLEPSIIVAQDTEIAWKRRQNGTWHTLETTKRSDTLTQTTGDHTTIAYGHWRTSTTGSEAPTGPWHAAKDCPGAGCERPNPKMKTEVWATSMDSQTGSPKCPVPSMTDERHATTMSSELHARDMRDQTFAKTLETTTAVSGDMDTHVSAVRSSTLREAGVITDLVSTPLMTSLVLGEVDTRFLGAHQILTIGTTTDIQLGAELSITAPLSCSVTLGAALNAFLGVKADLNVGGTMNVSVGTSDSVSTAAKLNVTCITSTRMAPLVTLAAAMVSVG